MIHVLAWSIAGLLVILTVVIHYEAMLAVSDRILPWAHRRFRGRSLITISIGALLLGHIAEIWLFGFALMIVSRYAAFGAINGDFNGSLNDFIYFSAVNYTSLGDNAIHPAGPVRAIAASETLAGMMMIAWSASFTYLKMEQIWRRHRKDD